MKYSKKMVLVDLDDKRGLDAATLNNARSFEVKTSVQPIRNPNHGDFDYNDNNEKLSAIDLEIMKTLKNNRISMDEKVHRYGYLVKKYQQMKDDSRTGYEQRIARNNDDISRKISELVNRKNSTNSQNDSARPVLNPLFNRVSNLIEAISSMVDPQPQTTNAASITDDEPSFHGFTESDISGFKPRRHLFDDDNSIDEAAGSTTLQQAPDESSYFTPGKRPTSTPTAQTSKDRNINNSQLAEWVPLVDQVMTRSRAKKKL